VLFKSFTFSHFSHITSFLEGIIFSDLGISFFKVLGTKLLKKLTISLKNLKIFQIKQMIKNIEIKKIIFKDLLE
jgi:hypothetical protein